MLTKIWKTDMLKSLKIITENIIADNHWWVHYSQYRCYHQNTCNNDEFITLCMPVVTVQYSIMTDIAVSMHGLTRVTDSSVALIRRVIWGIILLTGLGFSFYNIIIQTLYYSNTPINVRFEIVRKKLLPLPVITFCNYNSLTMSSIRAWGLQDTIMNSYPLWVELNKTEPNYDQYNFTGVDEEFWRDFYDIHSPDVKDLVIQVQLIIKAPIELIYIFYFLKQTVDR